ncbi:hypothetical protein DXG01_003464 [Tephrocybe rancida]|nr:hypothetical protein DXG01_003464 [Tephrocybe rancida]
MSFADSVLIVLLTFPHSDYHKIYRFPHGLDMSVDEFSNIELMDNGVVRDTLQLDIVPNFSGSDRCNMHRFRRRMSMDINESGDIVLTDKGVIRNEMKLEITSGQVIHVHAFFYSLASLKAAKGCNFVIESALVGDQIGVAIQSKSHLPLALTDISVPEKLLRNPPTLTDIALLLLKVILQAVCIIMPADRSPKKTTKFAANPFAMKPQPTTPTHTSARHQVSDNKQSPATSRRPGSRRIVSDPGFKGYGGKTSSVDVNGDNGGQQQEGTSLKMDSVAHTESDAGTEEKGYIASMYADMAASDPLCFRGCESISPACTEKDYAAMYADMADGYRNLQTEHFEAIHELEDQFANVCALLSAAEGKVAALEIEKNVCAKERDTLPATTQKTQPMLVSAQAQVKVLQLERDSCANKRDALAANAQQMQPIVDCATLQALILPKVLLRLVERRKSKVDRLASPTMVLIPGLNPYAY